MGIAPYEPDSDELALVQVNYSGSEGGSCVEAALGSGALSHPRLQGPSRPPPHLRRGVTALLSFAVGSS